MICHQYNRRSARTQEDHLDCPMLLIMQIAEILKSGSKKGVFTAYHIEGIF